MCDDKGRCMIADLGLVCSNIRPDLSNKPEEYEDYLDYLEMLEQKSEKRNQDAINTIQSSYTICWRNQLQYEMAR